MTDVTVYDVIPERVVAAEPARPRLLLIGTMLASAAVTMGMAGLLGIYLETRAGVIAQGERWLPDGVNIPLTQPNMMAMTLCMSVLAMVWAVASIKADDRANTYIALGLSLMFGFAYMAQTAYLLTILEMPIRGDVLERPPLLYALIGTHLAVMGAAMLYTVAMGLRTLGGEYNSKDVEGLYGVATFWTVAVVLYLAVWYAIYITK